MDIEDVAVGDIAERWFGRSGPGEVLPSDIDWLPDGIRRQYADVSSLLWRKRSLFPVETPRRSRVNSEKFIFMSFDEREWLWAYDENCVDRFYDHGPYSDEGWKAVESSLAGLLAQRVLLEIALGPISWRWASVIPQDLVPDVTNGLTEIRVCQWQAFPGLRIYIGDGILAVVNYNFGEPALSGADENMLEVTVAADSQGRLGNLAHREWPFPVQIHPGRSLEWLRKDEVFWRD
ncbi:hypothetical protein [Actinoplanes sp. HUAS TT8]|uniref:hypothetical protein n=1 Tax=Actinoplanes sp. HUAS TT8 TaxID=3447453 RepID=UPI003F522B65